MMRSVRAKEWEDSLETALRAGAELGWSKGSVSPLVRAMYWVVFCNPGLKRVLTTEMNQVSTMYRRWVQISYLGQ